MLKDIAVHLDGSPEDRTRMQYAEQIARTFDAYLTGLFVHLLPEMIFTAEPSLAPYLQEMIAESQSDADGVEARLRDEMDKLPVRSCVQRLDVFPIAAALAVGTAVRTSDLYVALRPYGEGGAAPTVAEAVLFNCGGACFFVPPGSSPPGRIETITLAWKNCREAARAMAEAMPFLALAERVDVVIVEEGDSEGWQNEQFGSRVVRHLDRHGIRANVRPIPGKRDAGEAILVEVASSGSDLLVMGAYGHSRFREWVLGGVTRDILTMAAIPVLAAH